MERTSRSLLAPSRKVAGRQRTQALLLSSACMQATTSVSPAARGCWPTCAQNAHGAAVVISLFALPVRVVKSEGFAA